MTKIGNPKLAELAGIVESIPAGKIRTALPKDKVISLILKRQICKMKNRIKLAIIVVTLLLAVNPNASCLGGQHHSKLHGYNLSLPPGWAQIPQDALDRAIPAVSNPSSKHSMQCAGFQLANATGVIEYPYVLVRVIPYASLIGLNRQIRESEFPKVIESITGLNLRTHFNETLTSDARSLFSNLQTNTLYLDSSRRRFLWELEMEVEGIGQVEEVSAGHFGRKSLVQVGFCSIKNNGEDFFDSRSSIIESFYFDDDFAYNSQLGSNSQTSTWGYALGKAIGFAIIAALVALFSRILASAKRNKAHTSSSIKAEGDVAKTENVILEQKDSMTEKPDTT